MAGIAIVLVVLPGLARAHGESKGTGEFSTAYEHFVVEACSPCATETYSIATLPVAPIGLGWFPRNSAGGGSRAGTIVVEVLRAQELGRSDWPAVALRLTLAVVAPGAAGSTDDMYRLGSGLLDAREVPALARAVAAMAKPSPVAAATPSADGSNTDFHGGSLRVGVLRIGGDTVSYVQVGELLTLLQRPVWEVPAALYLPVPGLSALASALDQAATTIEKVRNQ
jgi:hypothetical protein